MDRMNHMDRMAGETPNTGVSGLEQLPAELLLKVLCSSPDLSSLHSLLLASAAASRVFLGAARHVTDAVVSASLPPPTQAAARAVVRIRASAHDCRTVADVRTLALAPRPGLAHETPSLPGAAAAASPALLRRFVALAHELHCLAHACADSYLARCHSLRPARVREPHFSCTRSGRMLVPPRDEWQPYEVPAQDPPSWVEEQRVLRDVWLVQAFCETRRASRDGALAAWPGAELAELEGMSAVDFYGLDFGYRREQMLTVVDFLGRLSGDTTGWTPDFRMPPQLCDDEEEGAAGRGFHLVCSPELRFASSKEDRWRQGREQLDRLPMGWVFQRRMVGDWRSPVQCLGFEPYRRYGFAIWDNKRLTSLGFFTGDMPRAWLEPFALYFTWQSILTDEEIEGARRAYEATQRVPV